MLGSVTLHIYSNNQVVPLWLNPLFDPPLHSFYASVVRNFQSYVYGTHKFVTEQTPLLAPLSPCPLTHQTPYRMRLISGFTFSWTLFEHDFLFSFNGRRWQYSVSFDLLALDHWRCVEEFLWELQTRLIARNCRSRTCMYLCAVHKAFVRVLHVAYVETVCMIEGVCLSSQHPCTIVYISLRYSVQGGG